MKNNHIDQCEESIKLLFDKLNGLSYELIRTREKIAFLEKAKSKVLFISTDKDASLKKAETIKRARYYLEGVEVESFEIDGNVYNQLWLNPIICTTEAEKLIKARGVAANGIFNVDYESNHLEGWQWHNLLRFLDEENHSKKVIESKKLFLDYMADLKRHAFERCYIFGTGPSLAKARDMRWDDGFRVVCNTIVRDKNTWHHIKPHIFVAGDPMYHFGFTKFAETFRKDLRNRLTEDKSVLFVYPREYDTIVRREFAEFIDRLVPIPVGEHKDITVNFEETFLLPELGNVLSLLLLPLACFLSKKVCLWGFDGRAPNDNLFWKNSKNHTYDEYLPDLVKAHPAFFEHNVPTNDPTKYVRAEQGDELDSLMKRAEFAGWEFIMMHKSWTNTLQKRFAKD